MSKAGVLRSGKKSDILDCICFEASATDSCPSVDVLVLDGAAIVHMLMPGNARTFSDYVDSFISLIHGNLKKASRVDVVFDAYHVATVSKLPLEQNVEEGRDETCH
jgi:hypothetical protein